MFELLKKLTNAFGVSGNEEEIRKTIMDEINGSVDELYEDALGNLIAHKKGTGKKLMFAAHMDEIGLIATNIDDKGFIRFSNIGWVSPFYLLSQRVRFKNGTMGTVYYEEKLEDMKNLKLSSMFIDIGAPTREAAEDRVRVGDTASIMGEAVSNGDYVTSKALDDRAGCAVLIETIKNCPKTEDDLYFVFTVQEELGLRGAKAAAKHVKPDYAIAVDVTLTGDLPGSKLMEVCCGKGPAVKIKDSSIICHPKIKRLLTETAASLNIPIQFEILESGGNDSGAVHLQNGGIPSGALSIPCRYVHSPIESASLKDITDAVALLKGSIENLKLLD